MNAIYEAVETHIHAGLLRPVRLLQLSDMHLTRGDACDSEYVQNQQGQRRFVFRWDTSLPTSEELFAYWMGRADEFDCVVLTGDTIDAPSHGNLTFLSEHLKGHNYLYVTGNHDWAYPPDYKRPENEVRAQYFPSIEAVTGQSLVFTEKQVGGVTLIGLDNSREQINEEQYKKTFAILDRGQPVVICAHVPFDCETLRAPSRDYWLQDILCGYPRPTELTAAFVRRLKDYKNLTALLTGHIHFNHEDVFSPYTVQYVTQTAVHLPIVIREGKEVPHSAGQARIITID